MSSVSEASEEALRNAKQIMSDYSKPTNSATQPKDSVFVASLPAKYVDHDRKLNILDQRTVGGWYRVSYLK